MHRMGRATMHRREAQDGEGQDVQAESMTAHRRGRALGVKAAACALLVLQAPLQEVGHNHQHCHQHEERERTCIGGTAAMHRQEAQDREGYPFSPACTPCPLNIFSDFPPPSPCSSYPQPLARTAHPTASRALRPRFPPSPFSPSPQPAARPVNSATSLTSLPFPLFPALQPLARPALSTLSQQPTALSAARLGKAVHLGGDVPGGARRE